MPDLLSARGWLEEAMPAVAAVFDEPVALGDGLDAMPEDPAGVPHLLGKPFFVREAVHLGRKDQRMSATHADVLVHPVAVREAHVGVVAQETGQGMTHVCGSPVLGQVLDAALAVPGAGRSPEHLVVHDVAPEPAAETHPECAHALYCEFPRTTGSRYVGRVF